MEYKEEVKEEATINEKKRATKVVYGVANIFLPKSNEFSLNSNIEAKIENHKKNIDDKLNKIFHPI